ncbi:MAG: hypothetical protein BWY72_02022 [Bacteroidetes bacterium ADurb.Bin416]|nr:MAG: hypothetical protein BWY72_02022 [Bacteroidetes bacterium ADurb.Bin416]
MAPDGVFQAFCLVFHVGESKVIQTVAFKDPGAFLEAFAGQVGNDEGLAFDFQHVFLELGYENVLL